MPKQLGNDKFKLLKPWHNMTHNGTPKRQTEAGFGPQTQTLWPTHNLGKIVKGTAWEFTRLIRTGRDETVLGIIIQSPEMSLLP